MNYSFINAKISAIKSKMLKREDYEALIELETIDEVIDRLEKTYYREAIQKYSIFTKGSSLVEFACYSWMVGLFKKIIKYSPEKELCDIFLKRHEIRNLKLLISAKIRGKKWEEVEPLLFPISDLIDYRRFYEAEFSHMLNKVEIGKEILAISLKELWKGKERIMHKLIKEGKTHIFLLSSLELYYGYLLEKEFSKHKHLRPIEILLKEQDIKNISLLLRLKERGEHNLMENFLYGGTLTYLELEKAYHDDIYRERLIEKFGANPKDDIAKIEFDMYLNLAKEKKSFKYKILSLEKVLGFFVYGESECDRLRLIARGKEVGVDKHIIEGVVL